MFTPSEKKTKKNSCFYSYLGVDAIDYKWKNGYFLYQE